MCTLTFIPGLPGGGYLLATNRDESPTRAPATAPTMQQFGSRQVLAPRDPDGGGTWVGVDDSGHCLAILNGDRPLPLGMLSAEAGDLVSRGLLVNDLLEDPRADSVRDELQRRQRLNALHYKPFKLIVVSPGPGHGAGRAASTLRADWDGVTLRFEEAAGPRCFVSSSHETEAVTNYRRAAFERFLQNQSRALERAGAATSTEIDSLGTALAGFHASHHPDAPQGDARSVCMHRDEARTVSSTLVLVTGDEVVMRYRAGWPCQGGETHVSSLKRAS
jgi:hypothetical protein